MPLKLKETIISTKHNRLKNPSWWETEQLAIYKQDRGVELGSTEKQLQLSGQSGNPKSGALTTWPLCLATTATFICPHCGHNEEVPLYNVKQATFPHRRRYNLPPGSSRVPPPRGEGTRDVPWEPLLLYSVIFLFKEPFFYGNPANRTRFVCPLVTWLTGFYFTVRNGIFVHTVRQSLIAFVERWLL